MTEGARHLYRWDPKGPTSDQRRRHVWLKPSYDTGPEVPGLLIDWFSDDRGAWWAFVIRRRTGPTSPSDPARAAVAEVIPAGDARPAKVRNPPGANSGGAVRVDASTRHAWVRPPHSSSHAAGLVLGWALEAPDEPIALVAYVKDPETGVGLYWADRSRFTSAEPRA